MPWNLLLSSAVVSRALFTPVHAAHRDPILLVEERRWPVVLVLPELDDETMAWVVRVDGKLRPTAVLARVAEQPVEPMLATSSLAQDLIDKVNNIGLVTSAVWHPRIISPLAQIIR